MRDRALLFVLSMSLSVAAQAQVNWQPTPAPLVTAENTSWFSKGEPVHWNGDLYYPTRAVQHFDQYQMVRTGTFNGIPLYINPALESGSILFVPLSGGLVQPYERARLLEPAVVSDTIAQAPSAPSRALPYEPLASPAPATVASLSDISEPMVVGTSGRTVPLTASAANASARVAPRRVTVATLNPPTGLNGIWVNFDGRRWVLDGKAIDYDPATLAEVGTYHGWSVYTRSGDASTIYIPTTPGRLAPYRAR